MKVSELTIEHIGKVVHFAETEDVHEHAGVLQAITFERSRRGLSLGGMLDDYELDEEVEVAGSDEQPQTITFLHDRDDSEGSLHSYIHDVILHWEENRSLGGHTVLDLTNAIWDELLTREVKP